MTNTANSNRGKTLSLNQPARPPAQEAPPHSGVLIIDKPAGMTSHDVVARVRRLLGMRQVGHFGTLDPFATGVLPLSVGKATRFAQFYLRSRKAYEGSIRFGFSTDTYDATGRAAAPAVPLTVDAAHIEEAFADLTGRLMQTPPPFSAKRVKGVRAYQMARRNEPLELAPVAVEIYALELLDFDGQSARFAAECSGGTYMRSLAHDVGKTLGCGAHLAGLRRTAVAEFKLDRAVTLDQLEADAREGRASSRLVPLEALLPECPELMVRGREEKNVRHGHHFELAQVSRFGHGAEAQQAISLLKILNQDRRLIAIARHVSERIYHPDLVLL
jgi:tRNA pseudouridine55 synthase